MTRLVHIPANPAGRDFVVGDLHGCFDALERLLEGVQFNPLRDRLFAVGDLIDRGAKSAECVRLLEEPWFFSVMGNHEVLMLEALATDGEREVAMWMRNGGVWAAGHVKAELHDLAALIEPLPHVIVVGDGANRFAVLHAEYLGDDETLLGDWDEHFVSHTCERMLWGRALVEGHAPDQPGMPIYCGHTIVHRPMVVGRHHFIDTGAYREDGRLTMVEPATGWTWFSPPVALVVS